MRFAPIAIAAIVTASIGVAYGQDIDWSGINDDNRQWVEDSCKAARRLGPSYHQPCLERNIKAIKSHDVTTIVPESVQASCQESRRLGPYYYYACLDQKPVASFASPNAPRALARPEAEPREALSLPAWAKLEIPALSTATRTISPEEVFRQTAPSIYVVLAAKNNELLRRRQEVSQGSAVAVTDRELITNCHVVTGRPFVLLAQGNQTTRAEVAASDRRTDRCVLRSQSPVHAIRFVRRYEDLAVGERTYTVGSPSGLENTLSEGLISGLRRLNATRFVQTTAAVSPGSSGGGLFDARGNLIGITTFIARDAQNLNFAISVDEFLGR